MDCLLLEFFGITWLVFCHHPLLQRVYQISLLPLYQTGGISYHICCKQGDRNPFQKGSRVLKKSHRSAYAAFLLPLTFRTHPISKSTRPMTKTGRPAKTMKMLAITSFHCSPPPDGGVWPQK